MGVADRVRAAQLKRRAQQVGESGQSSQSSLVLADPEHIARLKGVMSVLTGYIKNGPDTGMARMAFFLGTVTDELAEELRDMDEATIRVFLFQIGEVIAWIGHGDNERLPEAIRGFAEQIQPPPPSLPVEENATDTASGSHSELDTATGRESSHVR
jgi:hypothetical protein